MQVDEVDPVFARVINDVVDVEVAMDIDREGGGNFRFALSRLLDQLVEREQAGSVPRSSPSCP